MEKLNHEPKPSALTSPRNTCSLSTIQRSPLEEFVATCVAALEGIGEAEEACELAPKLRGHRADERLAFCREQAGIRLEELVRVVFSSHSALTRVRALLAHHAFRVSRSEQTEEATRQRIRELSSLLARIRLPANSSASNGYSSHRKCSRGCSSVKQQVQDEREASMNAAQARRQDELLVAAILGLSHPRAQPGTDDPMCAMRRSRFEVVKRALLEPRAIDSVGLEELAHADGSDNSAQAKMREVALCIINSKDTARTLRKFFDLWVKRVNKVSVACVKVSYALRTQRLKLMAQAFNRLGRHTAFQNGIILAQRQGAGSLRYERENRIYHSNNTKALLESTIPGAPETRPPWDKAARPGYSNSRPAVERAGRKMPWER